MARLAKFGASRSQAPRGVRARPQGPPCYSRTMSEPKSGAPADVGTAEIAEVPTAAARAQDGARDVVLVGEPKEGGVVDVLRLREDRIEAGELRPIEEGKPLYGELVKLSPRGEHPRLFDVNVLAAPPRKSDAGEGGRRGPALVNSEAFREGWESIFGSRPLN